jgi:hypothetical protein
MTSKSKGKCKFKNPTRNYSAWGTRTPAPTNDGLLADCCGHRQECPCYMSIPTLRDCRAGSSSSSPTIG